MPIHDHRGGNNIPGGYDPNQPINGKPPAEPTAEQIAAFKAQMADELAAKQAANEKETHESRKIVARELQQRAVKVDFHQNFEIKEAALFSGPDAVDKARGGTFIPGVDMAIPVVAHAEIHVHEIPTVEGVRGKTLERHEAGHPAQPGDPGYGVEGTGVPGQVPVIHDVNAPQNPEIKLERVAGTRVRAVSVPEIDPAYVVPGGQPPIVFESKAVIPATLNVETGGLDLGHGNRPRQAYALPEEVKPATAFGIPEFTGGSRIKPFFQRPAVRAAVPEGQNAPEGVIPKAPGQQVPYLPVVSAKAEVPVVPGESVRLPFDPAVRIAMPETAGLDPRNTTRFTSERPSMEIPGSTYFPSQKTAYAPPVAEKPAIEGTREKGPDGLPVAESFAVVPGDAVIPGAEIPVIPVSPGQDPEIIPGVDAHIHIKAVVPGAQPADPFVPVQGRPQEPIQSDPVHVPESPERPESPEGLRFTVHAKSVPGTEVARKPVVGADVPVPEAHAETHRELPNDRPEGDPAFEPPVALAVEVPVTEKPEEILHLDPAEAPAIEAPEVEAVSFEPVEHARRAEEPAETGPGIPEGIERPVDNAFVAIPEGNPILAVREGETADIPIVDNGAVVPAAEKPLYIGVEIPVDGSNPEEQIRAQQDLAFQGSQPVRFGEPVYDENPEVKPAERLVLRAEAGTEGRGVDHDRPGEIPLLGEDDAYLAEQTGRERSDRINDHEDDLPPVVMPGQVHLPGFDPVLFNANPGYQPPVRDHHESTLAHEVVQMVDRFLVTAEQGSYVKEVHMTMNHEILPGTEIQFRQVGNSLQVTFVNMDGGNLELLRREAPDLAESLRTHTGDAVEIRIVTAVGGETV